MKNPELIFDPILIRNNVRYAERIFVSRREDYIVYRYNNKTYVVMTKETTQ